MHLFLEVCRRTSSKHLLYCARFRSRARASFRDFDTSLHCRCICGECAKENLVGALEHRCCREIAQASQKLTFDGSIERVSCITKHDDFSPMINRSVLLQVGPLLRDKNGRGYRRRDGQTENQ